MDKHREKIAGLREEANAANERADSLERALKQLMDEQTEREQEIISLQNRITRLEEEAEVRESQLEEAKQIQKNSEATLNESDVVMRKVVTLQDTLEETETLLHEAREKASKLDLENEKLNRVIAQNEKNREDSEARYEELNEKYAGVKKELDEIIRSLDDM
ncbi:tropomyosin-2 [Coemansia spiralis]|uniref:Tropomyosin-2 n=2 Tax=Coemansia TaxID=4863 RepID=A0A9W8KZ58_9FUNG|nr:tropomyosin [Coemansia spiralis]KAJ1995728.1 tropomyosin-2 [Coemansia umbellata]KAJ2623668.1 tropomyosin-2 [Coemansia sp. RSA 1358]KAJ2680413.1 tropomyosin-2 [Coemansia spiralis]